MPMKDSNATLNRRKFLAAAAVAGATGAVKPAAAAPAPKPVSDIPLLNAVRSK